MRIEGHREAVRVAYLASADADLASADLAYNFNNVRRASVERVPFTGLIEAFDLASVPTPWHLAGCGP